MTVSRAIKIVAGAALVGLAVGYLKNTEGMTIRLTIVGGCLGFSAACVLWLASLLRGKQ